MTPFLILALAVLQLSDPVADAIGDGSLVPPTAPVYATTANFDLQAVELTEATNLTLRVTLGALDNPGDLRLGFTSPVIEVYLDTEAGGAESLLPGSGMRMPDGQGWEIALRLTGDDAFLVVAQEEGTPSEWPLTPVTVTTEATTLIVTAPLPRPQDAEIYAISGVYDAFAPDAWREVTRTPTPWGFSSPTQVLPVVDVTAPTQAEQARALQTGVLPRPRSPAYGAGWLVLMMVGVMAAVVGLWFRRLAGANRTPATDSRAAELAAKVAPPRGGSAPVPAGPKVVWSPTLEPVPEPAAAEANEGTPLEALDDVQDDTLLDAHDDALVDAPEDTPVEVQEDTLADVQDDALTDAGMDAPAGSEEHATVPASSPAVVESGVPAADKAAGRLEPLDKLPTQAEGPPPATRGSAWEPVLVDPDDSFLDADDEDESLRWLDADPDPSSDPDAVADPDTDADVAPDTEPDTEPDAESKAKPADEGEASEPKKES